VEGAGGWDSIGSHPPTGRVAFSFTHMWQGDWEKEKRSKLPSCSIIHEQIFFANEKGHRIIVISVADPDPHQRI
jgi:hypothetical protein